MKTAHLLGLALLVLVLAGCGGTAGSQRIAEGPPEGPYRGSEPPPGIRVPNVTLPSYRGGSVSLQAQRGRVFILTFLDSKCTQTCPIIAALIGRTWPLLMPTERDQVRAYAISVNPLVDTPARVRRFLASRHALGALDWLVAPIERMRPVWHDFHVLPATETGNNDVHSADVRVFDREGIWVSTLHAGVDLTPNNLVHDIRLANR